MKSPAPLTKEHQTGGFDCGIESLNEWLIRRALKNEEAGGSRTYVVCDEKQVAGYYTISAGSITRSESPGHIRRNMPDPVPILVLGRLAVDLRHQGAGIGKGLLKDAVARSITVSLQVGVRALIVHALNDTAEAFYLNYGFQKGLPVTNTLFLPLR